MSVKFILESPFAAAGDQVRAIPALIAGLEQGLLHQTLLGVTGSGKTFTMATVIANLNRPTLVLAPNKTLAAQLYSEMRAFFPHNAVEYFVSYYDYYQPEAYVPSTDTYIEKDASINEHIEQLRLSATKSLLERRDVIIVATVSAIYGLGDPNSYMSMVLHLAKGSKISQKEILLRLADMQYTRNDKDFFRGNYRVRGDIIDIFPAESEQQAIRISLFGDEIDNIIVLDPLTGHTLQRLMRTTIYPKTHYVTPKATINAAIESIKTELKEQVAILERNNKLVEAQRLAQRTNYDLEMLLELGYCSGIENYSRYISKRKAGEAPPTLIDYLPADALLFVDESHVTIPQLIGMYRGDRARKENLVNYGFRLPSALDNRPLQFSEFCQLQPQTIYVSATPANYELELSKDHIVEQVVRPTGLLDPEITVRPATYQVDDLLSAIKERIVSQERVLVTTLTKRMSEDLTRYLSEQNIKVRYLHSDIDTVERVEIIRDLRKGVFDVLVGINLLREGLDMPEVSLVAILDADKEGFLRSNRSLIQTIGRAARNVKGKVILYGDKITASMQYAIDETNRRRAKQQEYNTLHGITPKSIIKPITDIIAIDDKEALVDDKPKIVNAKPQIILKQIRALEAKMLKLAKDLEFEQAALIRDELRALRASLLE